MATHYGPPKITTPDLRINVDKEGAITASSVYVVQGDSLGLPPIGSTISQVVGNVPSGFNNLKVEGYSTQKLEGDLTEVTINYSGSTATEQYGFESLGQGAIPIYRLDCRLTEREITKHPKFLELEEDEQRVLTMLYNNEAKPSAEYTMIGQYEYTGEFQQNKWFVAETNSNNETIVLGEEGIKFAKLIYSGVKSYLVPLITWSESAIGDEPLESDDLNAIGKIVASPRGEPPEPGVGRTWLLTNASQEQRGEVYQTAFEYTLSDEDGWDELLYTKSK